MRQAKIVFIIPGFGHKPTNKGYGQVSKLLKSEGYSPISVAIPWKESTITDNTNFFLKEYTKKLSKIGKKSDVYFLGFSYGALIAFLAATEISVKGLILCSLSPTFKEDLPKQLPSASTLSKKRHENFSKLHAKVLARKIKAKNVMMLYGSKESSKLIHRVSNTFDDIPTLGKYLFSIKKTDHNIADKKYISAIHHVTSFL